MLPVETLNDEEWADNETLSNHRTSSNQLSDEEALSDNESLDDKALSDTDSLHDEISLNNDVVDDQDHASYIGCRQDLEVESLLDEAKSFEQDVEQNNEKSMEDEYAEIVKPYLTELKALEEEEFDEGRTLYEDNEKKKDQDILDQFYNSQAFSYSAHSQRFFSSTGTKRVEKNAGAEVSQVDEPAEETSRDLRSIQRIFSR